MNARGLATIVLSAIVLTGCARETPVEPAASGGAPAAASDARRPAAALGTYTLSFFARVDGTFQEVTSLPVLSSELILRAYVADSAGAAAEGGTATFEYCSYKGTPKNDITRADEAPKEACEEGTAGWARLGSVSVNPGMCPGLGTGYACLNFGVVSLPRDIGFRFSYSPQGTSIAAGTSAARNFTWLSTLVYQNSPASFISSWLNGPPRL